MNCSRWRARSVTLMRGGTQVEGEGEGDVDTVISLQVRPSRAQTP